MRIAVITPSRSRVFGLCAVLQSLKYLESGKNEVIYSVISDEDDSVTAEFCNAAKHIPIVNRVGPRPESLGGAFNEMAEWLAENKGVEVFTGICDDILCITPDWDEYIRKAVEKTPHGVFWWGSRGIHSMYPIVTDKWRRAAGGAFTSNYPFWYDDLCLAELWTMATDSDNVQLECEIVDRPVRTTRMRELKFWQTVYLETRKLREKQAFEIAEKLGLPKPECPEYVRKLLDTRLSRVSDEWLDSIEKNQGETSPPDSSYLAAKAKAEALLASI